MQKSGLKVFFQGSYLLSLDAKGRITIPSQHRDALKEYAHGELTLTCNPDGKNLLIYPRPEWLVKREEIQKLPVQYSGVQRILIGSAQDVEIDSAGRVLIAPSLRKMFEHSKELVLVGMGRRFELWVQEAYDEEVAQTKSIGIPAELNFSL